MITRNWSAKAIFRGQIQSTVTILEITTLQISTTPAANAALVPPQQTRPRLPQRHERFGNECPQRHFVSVANTQPDSHIAQFLDAHSSLNKVAAMAKRRFEILNHVTDKQDAEQNTPTQTLLKMRRATPDSEAVASSEDERPWPMATTFGSLPRKENGVPGLGGGIWSTSQSRGSFKLGEQARRNAAREARMGAPNNIPARAANTPSPATSSDHGAASLPFTIPLQPTPKLGRSLSHSQGQREMPPASATNTAQASAGMERPAALPLGLLNEEIEDGDGESDRGSDLGGMLTQTVSHPVFGNLHRTSTLPTQFESPFNSSSNPRRSDTFDGSGFDRRYEAEFGDLTLSELGKPIVPTPYCSHIFAHGSSLHVSTV